MTKDNFEKMIANDYKLVKELLTHINYSLDTKKQPERTIYAIISEIKDLPIQGLYLSKESEKLARIYQSQFHTSNDNKLFPLGSETKLIKKLNKIIESEFPNVLKNNNILNKQIINKNISKLRDLYTDTTNNKFKIR